MILFLWSLLYVSLCHEADTYTIYVYIYIYINRWWTGKIDTYMSPPRRCFLIQEPLTNTNDFNHKFRDILVVPAETGGPPNNGTPFSGRLGIPLWCSSAARSWGLWWWPWINLCWWIMMDHNLSFLLTHFMSVRWLPGWLSSYAMGVNQEDFAGRPKCKW